MEQIAFGIGVIACLVGLLLLAAPQQAKKLSAVLNTVVFTDSKLFVARGAGGAAFILFGIFLLFVSEFGPGIWGEFLWGGAPLRTCLFLAGIISSLIGILFVIKPIYLVRLSDWGNRVIFSDEKLETHPRILGFLLTAAGMYIMIRMFNYM